MYKISFRNSYLIDKKHIFCSNRHAQVNNIALAASLNQRVECTVKNSKCHTRGDSQTLLENGDWAAED